MRSFGLAGAACLALAAEAIMIPSTVSMPGLTSESLSRHDGNQDSESHHGDVKALPISSDFREKLKDLQLGVSKPMPFSSDEDNVFWIQNDGQDDVQNDGDMEDEEDSSDFSITFIPLGTEKPPGGHADPKSPHQTDCPSGNSLFAAMCRFRNMVSSKIDHAKPYLTGHRRPCPKKLAAMAKAKADEIHPPKINGGIKKFWPHFHAGEAMPTQPWHGNHYFNEQQWATHRSRFQRVLHSFCNGLRRFVTGFVIPVLIGVAAGMTASLVGMCVGTLLAWVWIKFVRGGKRGNAGVIVVEEVDVIPEEKEGLLRVEPQSEDAPPVYIEKE